MATQVEVKTPKGASGGTVTLPDAIFGVEVNVPLMHQVVVAQLAAARRGTASTKTRGEVSGTGKKPYKQKGTGRARQGSLRSPQFESGGVAHGPKPRRYDQRTPKKMKAASLRSALSDRATDGRVHVVSAIVESDAPSTKSAVATLKSLALGKKVLIVATREELTSWLSVRNLRGVGICLPDQLSTYDVLNSDDVVFTKPAFESFVAGVA